MITFISDLHIWNHSKFGGQIRGGLNRRCREHLAVVEQAVNHSLQTSADALIVLGDTFDYSRPRPQLVAAVQQIFNKAPVIVLAGNHDCETQTLGDNAIAPLEPVCTIIDEPQVVILGDVELLCIPFIGNNPTEKFRNLFSTTFTPKSKYKYRVLAFHAGIVDESTPHYLKSLESVIKWEDLYKLAEDFGICAAFAGDFHERKVYRHGNFMALQVGTLIPAGWDDAGITKRGTLATLKFGKFGEPPDINWIELNGPRFIEAKTTQEIEQAISAKTNGHTVYLRTRIPDVEVKNLLEQIKHYGIEHVEILSDGDAGKTAARAAARAVCGAATLDAAVDAYVSAMPLAGGVARPSVLAKIKYYLRGRK